MTTPIVLNAFSGSPHSNTINTPPHKTSMNRILRKLSGKASKSADRDLHSNTQYSNGAATLSPQRAKMPSAGKTSAPFSTADLPPAYTSAPQPITQNRHADSPYAFLRDFDTVFVIDDSGSMAGRCWRETADALAAITPICTEQDVDGIDIYFLNHKNSHATDSLGGFKNVTSVSAVQEIFRNVLPGGGTPTGSRLHKLLKPYVEDVVKAIQSHARYEVPKPCNIIVITDGCANDDPESVIVQAAKKLDQIGAEPWQVGIQFFQVGRDADAAKELRELDDALSGKYGIRDMVDTVPWDGVGDVALTAETIMKVTMGAVNRRWDRKEVSTNR